MLLILFCLAPLPLLVGHAIGKADAAISAHRGAPAPPTYRNHKLTDPVAMAAAVKRHDRPYLGPRTRSKLRR